MHASCQQTAGKETIRARHATFPLDAVAHQALAMTIFIKTCNICYLYYVLCMCESMTGKWHRLETPSDFLIK